MQQEPYNYQEYTIRLFDLSFFENRTLESIRLLEIQERKQSQKFVRWFIKNFITINSIKVVQYFAVL